MFPIECKRENYTTIDTKEEGNLNSQSTAERREHFGEDDLLVPNRVVTALAR